MTMRALVFAIVLGVVPCVVASAGFAQTSRNARIGNVPPSEPHRPLIIRIPPSAPPPAADLPLRLEPYRAWNSDSPAAAAVSIGPVRARLGGTARRAHIARYKLEGMDILGGSISGTLDTRGARLYLRWPPKDDD